MTTTPAKAATDPAIDRPPIFSFRNSGGKQQRDQWCNEGQRDRLGQWHPADAPEEEEGHHRDDHPASDVDDKVLRVGQPLRCGR